MMIYHNSSHTSVPMTPRSDYSGSNVQHWKRAPLCDNRPRPLERLPSEGILTAARALLSLSPSANESNPQSPTVPRERVSPKSLGIPVLLSDNNTENHRHHHKNKNEKTSSPQQHLHTFFSGCTSLALPQDEESLSPLHCFMRRYCVEAFSATPSDCTGRTNSSSGRRIVPGQVGIRCIHCKHCTTRQERAVCFPSSLKNIYHSIETWQRRHSLVCRHIPKWIKSNLTKLMETSRSGAGGRRQYWEESARRIGIADTDGGLRFVRMPGQIESEEDDSCCGMLSTTTNTSSTGAAANAPGRPVVSPDDKTLVTGYLFVLLEQMEACQFTEQDRTGGRSKVKDCPVGFPGLQCKHCGGKAGFGRYFPTTLRALTSANSDRNIYNHVMKCRRCPDQIRDELSNLQNDHSQKNCKNKRGWRKKFFRRVWQNLHGASSDSSTVVPAATVSIDTTTQEIVSV